MVRSSSEQSPFTRTSHLDGPPRSTSHATASIERLLVQRQRGANVAGRVFHARRGHRLGLLDVKLVNKDVCMCVRLDLDGLHPPASTTGTRCSGTTLPYISLSRVRFQHSSFLAHMYPLTMTMTLTMTHPNEVSTLSTLPCGLGRGEVVTPTKRIC